MKRALTILLATTTLASVATAGPLQRDTITANAKWVLHLDLDKFRQSTIGRGLLEGIVAKQAEAVQKAAKLDLPSILENTHSITAYGTDYQSGAEGKGVLLWRGSTEIEQIANAYLIQQAEASKSGEGVIRLVTKSPFPIYSLDDEMRAAVRPGQGLIMGRSAKQIEEAAKVLDGKAKSLAGTKTFSEYPALSGGFFLMAFAEAFNTSSNMPAQANVLKLTDGGRFAVGEMNESLVIELILRAQSEETTQQIQQVIQGLVALATMSQGENPDLQALIRGTAIKVEGRQVRLNLAIPLAEAVKQLERKQNEKAEPADDKK